MDGFSLVLSVCLGDTVAHVLVNVLTQERCDARHHHGGIQKHIEECVQASELLLGALFALHSGAVESHVPVSELLKELKHVLHDIIQAVVVHLIPHDFDKVLVGSNDPLVHDVGVLSLPELILEGWVKDEVGASVLLQSGDVLNEETVSVEPGQEDVSHDALNTL